MRHTYTFQAGETTSFPGGRFVKIINSEEPLDIRFFRADGVKYETLSQVDQGTGARDSNGWDFLEVESATIQTVELEILVFDMVSDTLAGSVSISSLPTIDISSIVPVDAYNHTADGEDYIGGYSVGATPGNHSYVALRNGAGSGKDLHVTNISASNSLGALRVRYDLSAQISAPWNEHTVTSSIMHNKRIGDANGVATIWYYNGVAITGTEMSAVGCESFGNPAYMCSERSPIIVPAGYALIVRSDAVNSQVKAQFEWREADEIGAPV